MTPHKYIHTQIQIVLLLTYPNKIALRCDVVLEWVTSKMFYYHCRKWGCCMDRSSSPLFVFKDTIAVVCSHF